MKTKLTLALVASLTSTAFAAFQAPLPEFKNEKQLAEWRAEKATEATSQGYVAEETAFYTGKPYLASTGSYAFKYRNYSPELARWTSEDPSGFPDGANNSKYVESPTSEFDYEGLAITNMPITGMFFDFGAVGKRAADVLLNPHPFQLDVLGTVVKNSTQDPMTVAYNVNGIFDASAKFLDFGVAGKVQSQITMTATVQKGWSIKLITHWEASVIPNPVTGALMFKRWELYTYE